MTNRNGGNRYDRIIEGVFFDHYQEGLTEFTFSRDELLHKADELGIPRPRNIGDLVYTFRYRRELPATIQATSPEPLSWVIRPAGAALYRFVLSALHNILPTPGLAETKVPDATPGVISMYRLSDEQALLAIIRYNRLLDIFTRVTCYPLQSHLRTQVAGLGQVETDEIYVGVDRRGAHFVLPVQAKGGTDRLSVIQIEQDFAVCTAKFPDLIARPIAAQFMGEDLIALFEFEKTPDEDVRIVAEKHYRLVAATEITGDDLAAYRLRNEE
jgi:hypothetical protein